MPTYSYRCTECDNAFDIHQAFTDDTLTVCEVCGGKLRKLFNTIGVTFNGSGFYRTDSRNGGSGGSGSSSSGSSSSGSSSSSSSSSGGSSKSGSSSSSSGSGSSGGGSSASS
ncbi:FmdB family transcriptional regulator [Agromyces sp. Root81]|uniref:FmdB family zinc ribbon protein n=1 Tax=Agromyces sp. Root81 TaxID=1736601 RepID=UPI000700ADD0|nr:FmdB family zinc ribbon protein [Agromyces sp. Root81]KRC59029.1 FmdB family transcriptional regulator [Agromyces sp. Root81]